MTDHNTVQIVITKAGVGFNVIIMSASHVLLRTVQPTREHALAIVADFMKELVEPAPAQ